jgi:hypothetical protein
MQGFRHLACAGYCQTVRAYTSLSHLFADSIDSEPVDSGNLSIRLEDEQRVPPKSSNVLHPHNMQQPSTDQPRAILSIPNTAFCRISESVEADTSRRKDSLDIGTQREVTESVMQLEESIVSDLFSLSAFSHTELMALVQDTPTRTARIKEFQSFCELSLCSGSVS